MADSADLVVLGAYFGTGNKGTTHSLINIWTGVRVYMCIYLEMHFFTSLNKYEFYFDVNCNNIDLVF